jgi:tetratricopeptide (TPR) repeat protein
MILSLQGCVSLEMCTAVSAYGNKDYLKVREITARVIQDNPNLLQALTLNGWSQFQLGDLDSALSDFKKIQLEYPENFHGYLGEAWILIMHGNLEMSEKLLDKAQWWMGQHQQPMLRAARGWIAFYRNDLAEAERHFIQAEEDLFWEDKPSYRIESTVLASWSTLPWVGMGWVETAKGNIPGANKAFNKGLIRDTSCHLCYAGLSFIAEKEENIDKALRYAEQGLSVSRHDPELVATLNRLLKKKNSLEKSLEIYHRLVKKSGDDPLYLANLGYVYLYQNDLEQAEKQFRIALSIDPGHALATTGLLLIESQSVF